MANISSELEDAMDTLSSIKMAKVPPKPKCSNCISCFVCEPYSKMREIVTRHAPVFGHDTLNDLMFVLARQCKAYRPVQDEHQ